jgi:ribose transport system substrate-binding protein
MKRNAIVSVLCAVLAVLALLWGLSPVVSPAAKVQEETVALLLDTDIGASALQMKQGAKLAAREQKVELLTATPEYLKSDALSQAELMTQLLDRNVKALLLVPAKGEDLSAPLEAAAKRKVPVLILGETTLQGNTTCTISGDHEEAGRLAAAALTKRLSSPGQILLITGSQADDAAALRRRGALSVLTSDPELQIVAESDLSGKTADDMLALLNAYPQINGILVLTGEETELCALAMGRMSRHIPLVGMDCGQNRNLYLENGQVDAMVLGMPFAMGYLGVQFATQALGGEAIPLLYHTQSRVIDRENMYLPENQKLAFPMLQ